jgi:hypothetical protein
MRKLLRQDHSRQGIDFIDPRVAQLRWLAIKRRFIQHLPSKQYAGFFIVTKSDQGKFLSLISG